MFQNATGTSFGWQAIVDMYQRKCKRRESGHARMIPRLREIHIIRDSWTKLNVMPAKIMQVCCKVIINLAVYIHDFVARISPLRIVSVCQQ